MPCCVRSQLPFPRHVDEHFALSPEHDVTVDDSTSGIETPTAPSLWVCALLGIVMIAGGTLALGDVAFATIISAKLVGLTAAAVGAFEIIHALWTKGWGGFLWQTLLGILYLAFGLILFTQPASGALVLTYVLGTVLLASGLIRCLLSLAYWQQNGWMMLISGLFGLLTGGLILRDFPTVGIWALGLLLGVDLISHGLAWLLYAVRSVQRPA
jgi:uncharacterized membrane protein HdeD (DUF308 family)